MAIEISGPVSGLVRKALDASSMKHEVLSNNIANINTPGYKALKVSFEDQLMRLANADLYKNDDALRNELKNISPYVQQTDLEISATDIDVQMVDMAKNTIHYQTLLKGLKGYGSITKMAIKEGKG